MRLESGPPGRDQLNPDRFAIATPELVDIEMPLAGIGSRFIALLLDYLIWFAGFALISIVFAVVLPGIFAYSKITAQWVIAAQVFLFFLLNWGYFTLFEAFWNGQTPGKHIARIRVIQSSGRAIGLFESMARNLIRYVDQIPFFYVVGIIAVFCTRRHQRLGDLAAGTLVVRARPQEAPLWADAGGRTFTANVFAPTTLIPEPHFAVTLPADGIARLNAADLEVLEGFFARRLDMTLPTRHLLAQRIASALQAKSGLQIPPETSLETFLEATARQLRDVARLQ